MSSTPVTPKLPEPTGDRRQGAPHRAALLGGVIVVAILAVIVFAHAVRGSGKTTASAASTSAMSSPSTSAASTTGSMGGMSSNPTPTTSPGMGMSTSKVMVVRGATLPVMQTSGAMPVAMAMVPLGGATWEGMSIQARTSAPATFELFNGTAQQLVKPTAKDSFHLMVTLSDAATNVAIPYSSVWATITKNGKIVFDERLWPMISRYMGPHYGNNVALPAAGLYHLTLLVSPPAAARHLEYKGLWLSPHRVGMTFRWVPKT
jgi:hypothetical protein